jgi:hypothetical protein
MSIKHSSAYEEIVNIVNAANFHRAHCNNSECNVMLYVLGLTAKRLVIHCWLSERREAEGLIAGTDWS